MDKKLTWQTLAFVLLIVAFPIISQGTTHDSKATWLIGLLAFIAGSVVPVWTRFMDHSTDTPTDMGMEYDDRPS